MATYVPVNLAFNAVITKDALDHIEAGISAAAVSTDVVAALATKAPISNPTFTGTIAGITKGMVGLGNVDNTADTAKPLSQAMLSALATKAGLDSPSFTGTPTINGVPIGSSSGTGGTISGYTKTEVNNLLAAKAPLSSPTFTGTVSGVTTDMLPDFTAAVKNVIAATVTSGNGTSTSSGFDVVYNSTDGTIQLAASSTTGLSYDSSTGLIQLTGGYIDTTGSQTTSSALITETGSYLTTDANYHITTA